MSFHNDVRVHQVEAVRPDRSYVLSCPDCGVLLQTHDLACPICATASGAPPAVDFWTVHEHSKSFRTRHLVRPRTDRFVDEINSWLEWQPGIVDVRPLIHRDWHGVVKGATVTYTSSSVTQDVAFHIFRVPLTWAGSGLLSKSVAEALNDWRDTHPRLTRVNHQVWSPYGRPLECWLTAMGSRTDILAVQHASGGPEQGPRLLKTEAVKMLLIAATLVSLLSLFASATGTWPVIGPVAGAAAVWGAVGLRRRRWARDADAQRKG